MTVLDVTKNRIDVTAKEVYTTGSSRVYNVDFRFSKEWDGLGRTAVFRAGDTSINVVLDEPECQIPWEIFDDSLCGKTIYVGIYGAGGDGTIILPTVWAEIGVLKSGTILGEAGLDPTPGVYEQVMAALADKIDGVRFDGQNLVFTASGVDVATFDLNIIRDHDLLTGRDKEEQHPIESITGLNEIQNRDILKIWNGV